MAPNVGNPLPSSAHIFGIALVSSAAAIPDKPRTVLIEALFWNGHNPILGLFRYYNGPGIIFEAEERYFIHSTVARFDREAVSKSQELPPEADEFDIMGDIFSIIPALGVSAAYLPTVVVTGRPSKIMQENRTFEIEAMPWVSFGKAKMPFPFSGTIPQGGRWSASNCPFPNPDIPKYVSVVGFLTGTVSAEDKSKRFTVEIHSMDFLGAAPQSAPKAMAPTPKGKRKSGLDFSNTPSKKAK